MYEYGSYYYYAVLHSTNPRAEEVEVEVEKKMKSRRRGNGEEAQAKKWSNGVLSYMMSSEGA
jgi:hypothetical protein